MILGADGEPVVSPGLSEQPLGSNWPEDDQMSPYRFVGDGRAPEDSDEVVIDERSATAAGIEVGDQVVIVGKGEPRSYEVVGIVTTSQGGLPEGSSLALFTTDEARSLFESPDNDNRVAIRLEPDADPEQVAAAVRAVLPAGAEVVDGATGAQHRQESITRSFTLVRVLITGFALLALVVGMVTVANSLTLLYAERRRTFAGLRLVGAHQRQLLAAALVEAAALAAVASLLGVPLGLLLARLIEGAVGALGTSIPVGGSVVSVPALVGAVVIGTVATVLAAIVPAVRACRVAPIEAVADSPAAARVPWSVRIANAALVGVGAIVLLAGLMMLGDVSATTALAAAVAVVLVGGVLAFLPTVLSLAVAAGIRLVPTRPAALSRIGARDAVRNRSRTAATTGALLLATAVVAGLAVFLASFASSVDGDVGRLVRSDLVVDSGTFTRGGLPTELLAELDDLPEVAAVSGWQVGRVTIASLPLRITGVDGAVVDQVLDPAWTEDSGTRISPSGIALDASTAESLGVRIGDSVPVMFTSGGVEQLTLEGTYTQGSLLLGEAMIDRATLLRQVPASVDIAALVALTDDDPEDVAAVEQVAADYGVDAVLRPSEFVDARSELLNGFQRVIQWMLLFTLLQALVGVVNTLLLSVGERRREFGLLRVTGASRRQLMRLVLVEGLSFAVVGTALGLVVGVGGAILAVRSLGQYGISTIDVPAGVLVVTAAAAMVLGVAAAVAPARWASSVPPLEAVADAGGDRGSRRRTRRGTSGAAPPAAVMAGAGAPPVPMPEAVPPPFPAHRLGASTVPHDGVRTGPPIASVPPVPRRRPHRSPRSPRRLHRSPRRRPHRRRRRRSRRWRPCRRRRRPQRRSSGRRPCCLRRRPHRRRPHRRRPHRLRPLGAHRSSRPERSSTSIACRGTAPGAAGGGRCNTDPRARRSGFCRTGRHAAPLPRSRCAHARLAVPDAAGTDADRRRGTITRVRGAAGTADAGCASSAGLARCSCPAGLTRGAGGSAHGAAVRSGSSRSARRSGSGGASPRARCRPWRSRSGGRGVGPTREPAPCEARRAILRRRRCSGVAPRRRTLPSRRTPRTAQVQPATLRSTERCASASVRRWTDSIR